MELTAYLVNESRARRPDLARDTLAPAWIPDGDRPAVRALWDEFADFVYPHDDLVVSLRGRYITDTLSSALRRHPDTVLVVCGAGFSSYPWLLPFPVALEVDLPDMVEAKQRRVAELVAAGVIPKRDVKHLAMELSSPVCRQQLTELVHELAGGRPVAYVAEGLVFYLPPEAARAVVSLGAGFGAHTVTTVSYWPASFADNQVLADQRHWFRRHSIPDDATYLTYDELPGLLGTTVENHGPEDLQRRYLGRVVVPESHLIPEYVVVSQGTAQA